MLFACRCEDQRIEIIEDLGRLGEAAWIDVSEATEEELALVSPMVPHTLPDEEDADEIESSTRSYVDEQGFHISILFLHQVEGKPENTSVTLVFSMGRLITVHDRDVPAIRLLRMRVRRQPGLITDPLGLFASLLEIAVLDLGDTLQELYRDLEETSHLVLEDPDADLEDSLARLARHENVNGKVRLCLMDARRDLAFVLRSAQATKPASKRIKFLMSEIDALLPHNNYLFEKVNFLLQAAQGFINIEQNKIIKIFSVAATAFLPPTLVASVYGMNFEFMPELQWKYGYLVSIGVMLISGVLPILYFKRKGWL
ncbi:MAG: magnesium/cobalt transporter CorA [Chromatiaceae bacterium]|nr:magnesium/cobalt transporter CorA [Chromatiaceae bacterium]